MPSMLHKLLRLALLTLILSGPVGAAQAEGLRLDPVLRALASPAYRLLVAPEQLVHRISLAWDDHRLPPAHVPPKPITVPVGTWDDAQVGVLVRTDRTYSGPLPGVRVQARHGPVVTGLASVTRLEELAAHPAVVFVEAARPVQPLLDVSVPEVRGDATWTGPRGTTGEGVIVGVVDTGIDITHPDFRVDRSDDGVAEGSRILTLWDQTLTADGSAARYNYTYGRVFARSRLEASLVDGAPPTADTHGHGTHVASIAAGGGAAGYTGLAPDAELVIVKTTFYTDGVVDGVAFVFKVADQTGLPAVVNLSLGGHSGPHDGTSNFEQAIDALVDRPGRAVVVAGGNEGDDKIHVGGDIDAPITWRLRAEASNVPVEFWHDGDVWFSVTVTAPGGETTTAHPGEAKSLWTPEGNLWLENPTGRDLRNEDKVVYLDLSNTTHNTQWQISFVPLDEGGRVDGWVTDSTAGYFVEGDSRSTISEPGNAHRVITVGAYTTKTSWTSAAGLQSPPRYTPDTLAFFSSHGPTRDGRPKPELAAPGAWIAAALSGDSTPNPSMKLPGGDYRMMAGTSMAAPHVAGAAALLFSLEPELDRQELVLALTSAARSDAHTGTVPNDAWGSGKLDVLASVAALPEEDLPLPGERPVLDLLENPVRTEAVLTYRLPEGTSRGDLHIYDLSGRRLVAVPVEQPHGQYRWDLITRWNRLVADGLYLAVLLTETASSEVQRLVVQR